MKTHTLILTSPKLVIPETDTKIIEFIKELILSNLLNVECFSPEMDNQCDYIDDEMESKNKNTTFLTFHFEDDDINYSNYNDESIFQFIYDKLKSENIGQVMADEKDIEIYIH